MNSETARFERCFLPHLDAAHNLARHLAGDAHEAEDVVQDALLRALRHFGAFRGENARAWLLMIVRRTFYTRAARRRDEHRLVAPDWDVDDIPGEDGPERELDRATIGARVRREIALLPPVFREVLVLRELEDLSYREISRITRVPLGTVMSRLARARARLHEALLPTIREEEGT